MSRSFITKSIHRNGKKANTSPNVSANNNTIYEEESPRDNKLMNSTVCAASLTSPPPKFIRNNSNPFPNKVTCLSPVQEVCKKVEESRQQKSFGKFLRYIRPNSKKKKTPLNDGGSYKQVEMNSPIIPETEIIPSPKSPPQKVTSQVYEQSINKHGDIVDYAVPFTEQLNSDFQIPHKLSECGSASFRRCEDVIDENVLNESKWNDRLEDIIEVSVTSPKRPNAKVTDLDKSSDGSRSLDQSGKAIIESNNKDVLSELDSLERWSQNIPLRSLPPQEAPVSKSVHIIECRAKEIKQRKSILKNTIAIPLHFSSGIFRKNNVSLRRCCPRDSTAVGLVEEAIERDYEILNRIKHPNIILLMAASFHRKSFEHMTLVLEPADFTLNYFLHQMDTTLPIIDCISVVQQIAYAAMYLQECGYIHSNISSHNILVKRKPLIVKLSSFELTTEVDFADTRVEILVKYRKQLRSITSNCADIPKYSQVDQHMPLKEQYKQMSKLVPILKCSPNTQHRYLSMISKHLIYDTNYRQHLSLHNFQAPELLTTKQPFVFPTTKADVYSLCLVLWEMLNKCVPFVVYSKVDLERMISSNKLKLPFFERERCEPFMSIFSVGLAVNPENRVMDVEQLITRLEDIQNRMEAGVKKQNFFQSVRKSADDNLYVNTTPQALSKDEGHKAMLPCSIEQDNIKPLNGSEGCVDNLKLSPNALEFKKCLNEKELTSTKKKRRKSPQQFMKKTTFRQLFKNSSESTNTGRDEGEISYTKLSESLDAIAQDIRREQSLDEIAEESHVESDSDAVIGPLLVKENELPSKILIEQKEPTFRENILSRNTQWRKTSPVVVQPEVSENCANNSKSCNNLFEASMSASRTKFFHSNITSPPINGFSIGAYSLPDTPIARKNKIRRNAWLAEKLLGTPNHVIDEELERIDNIGHSMPLDDSNTLNVSIRIVHNKVTPRKADSENTLVTSRIKFFDSNNEATNVPLLNTKWPNNDKEDDIDSNYSANYPTKVSCSKEITELASGTCNSMSMYPAIDNRITERKETFSNASTLSMSQKHSSAEAMVEGLPLDSDQTDDLGNKFWKREFDLCNRSQCSNDGDDESSVITPRWQSVRDKILKFEKCKQLTTAPSSPFSTESLRNISRTATQPNNIKFSEVPTLIKRTIYRESIVSGVDLSTLDNHRPIFDQLNLAGQKLTTQVTLNMRQIRRRSSDLDLTDRFRMEGTSEIRHTVCGNQKGLLSFNADALKGGSPGDITRYICSDCASKMSPDELKTLTFEPVADGETSTASNSLLSPMEDSKKVSRRRCQARVKPQNTRSIEDLYIDDDFDQGLGANIELQSDCSDFLNFDITSDVFDKSNEAS